jgi:hypothetical protein
MAQLFLPCKQKAHLYEERALQLAKGNGTSRAVTEMLLPLVPGPPGFHYHEAYLQVLPVARNYKMCNNINPSLDVSFLLYTA